MKARRQCGHGRNVTLGFELGLMVELEAMVGSCFDGGSSWVWMEGEGRNGRMMNK